MTHRRPFHAARIVCAVAGLAVLAVPAALAPRAGAAADASGAAAPPPIAPTQHRTLGNLVFENVPLPDAALMAGLGRYQQSREASFLDWLADGGMLIGTRFADTEQLHRVAAPLAMREQLTFYEDPIEWARAARGGGGFVFLKDQGGDENAQVYYQPPTGAARPLTRGSFIHGSPVWAHDGRRVAFYGNDRDSLSYDVYVADVTSGSPPQLLVGGHVDTWYPLDWSPDDSKLLVWKYVSISESYLYLADVATGALTPVEDPGHPHKAGIRMARFAPDGRGVYVVTDEDGEFGQLKLKDPVTHSSRSVTPDTLWDVEDFDVSGDGRYIAYVVNDDGRSRLTVLDTESKLELAPAGLPEGRIGNLRFDRTGRRLAMSAESPVAPRDAYVYDVEHGRLERWTRSEAGPIDVGTFTVPQLVHYPTWDRAGRHARMLSAYLYRPRAAGPHPVVILIHGGPEAQYRPGWDPFLQFVVNELGYAVVAPNVRGSSGYGKSFLALDNGLLREDAVRDIGSLLVWIGAQAQLDRDRVVVMGASYGGYMALASLISYGDRLRGGIDFMGISNFVTFLRNTSGYRQDLRRAEYGDERDNGTRVFLDRISPLTNAGRIRKPLLVAAGSNDPRVPVSESEQLVWRVRAAGGEVWYLLAKDEGHGFRKKANRDAYLQTVATFLQKLAR
jgi:dipeptidyl aminopeptidase/acylaminoacyl peptidase